MQAAALGTRGDLGGAPSRAVNPAVDYRPNCQVWSMPVRLSALPVCSSQVLGVVRAGRGLRRGAVQRRAAMGRDNTAGDEQA